ncbi:hypothetical protein CEXT_776501 [Caerostris extrusa]|uniref:Uncharacterized protein n=1 Tax=Caerostris extrusa TaxID=172846 RepID=A0AAV4TSJ1_CAEEX|nr:hypothetical protein CEXT_776501 [Caerostris extrusa]
MGVEWAPVPVMTTFSEKFAPWSERTAALFAILDLRGERLQNPVVPRSGQGRLAHCHRLSPLINTGVTSKTKGQAAKNSPGARKCSRDYGRLSAQWRKLRSQYTLNTYAISDCRSLSAPNKSRAKPRTRAITHCHRLSPLINNGTTSKTKGQAAKSPGAQKCSSRREVLFPKQKGRPLENSPGARKSSSHRRLCPVKCSMGSEWATVPVMTTFSEKFTTQFWGMEGTHVQPFAILRSGGAVRRSVV